MQTNILENIAIVLVEPLTGGNIGSVARAMTNMGLSDLRIVHPQADPYGDEAHMLAHGSHELLHQSKVYETIKESIADCSLILGTSHKPIRYNHPSYTVREIGPKILPYCQSNKVAILFGRENHGLSNEEINLCTWLVHIPTARPYPALNLAQAVIVTCYELFMAIEQPIVEQIPNKLATFEEIDKYLLNLQSILSKAGFKHKNDNPELFLGILRRLLTKRSLEEHELRALYKLSDQFRMIVERT